METEKIRKRITRSISITYLAIIATACSSADDLLPQTNIEYDPTAPIHLTGVVEEVDERTKTVSRAPINGTGAELPISLFRGDETYTAAYNSGPHDATITVGGTINTGLYYQSDPVKKSKLIGVYPKVDKTIVTWDESTRVITYPKSIIGDTDIIASALVEGSRSSTMSDMSFSHLLTQVKITVSASAEGVGKWGDVTAVTIAGKKQNVQVTLPAADGTATASAAGVASGAEALTVIQTADITPSTDVQNLGYAMFAPVTTNASLSLAITTGAGTFTKTSASQQYEAGKSYEIKLTFTATAIELTTVTIAEWGDGGSQGITL